LLKSRENNKFMFGFIVVRQNLDLRKCLLKAAGAIVQPFVKNGYAHLRAVVDIEYFTKRLSRVDSSEFTKTSRSKS